MLSIEPLRTDQYRQVAEWEHGPQPGDIDWELHAREMQDPRFQRCGLYLNGEFAGCVSFEHRSRNIAALHIATRRHSFHPDYLVRTLREIGGRLFDCGYLAIVAHAPADRRAAARLALRCGMREYAHTPTMRLFMMTRSRFYQNGDS